MFMDFSSEFNTILPQTLLNKLKQMEVNPYIIRWYHAFLIGRQQQVKVNSTLSDIQVISTGTPQGCVSSPLLFTLYTNDCRNQYTNNYIKFSDDTAILSLLTKDSDIAMYKSEIEEVVQWCEGHNLMLNVKKMKEMVFDPRSVGDHSPVLINRERVEQVTTYKVFTLILSYNGLIKWSMCVFESVSVCIICEGSGSMDWIKALCYCSTGQPLNLLFVVVW